MISEIELSISSSDNILVETRAQLETMESQDPSEPKKVKKPKVKLVPILIPVLEYGDSDSSSDDTYDKSLINLPDVGPVTLKTPKNIHDLSSFKSINDVNSEFSAINILQESALENNASSSLMPASQSNSFHMMDKAGTSKVKVTLPPHIVLLRPDLGNKLNISDNNILPVDKTLPISNETSNTDTGIGPNKVSKPVFSSSASTNNKTDTCTSLSQTIDSDKGPIIVSKPVYSSSGTPKFVGPNFVTIRKKNPSKYVTEPTFKKLTTTQTLKDTIFKTPISQPLLNIPSSQPLLNIPIGQPMLKIPISQPLLNTSKTISTENPKIISVCETVPSNLCSTAHSPDSSIPIIDTSQASDKAPFCETILVASGEEGVNAAHAGQLDFTQQPSIMNAILKSSSNLSIQNTRSYSRKDPVVSKIVERTSGEAIGLTNYKVVSNMYVARLGQVNSMNSAVNSKVDVDNALDYIVTLCGIDASIFTKEEKEIILQLNSKPPFKFTRGQTEFIKFGQNTGKRRVVIRCPLCSISSRRSKLKYHMEVQHKIDKLEKFPIFMAYMKYYKKGISYTEKEIEDYRNILDEILNYLPYKTKKENQEEASKKTTNKVLATITEVLPKLPSTLPVQSSNGNLDTPTSTPIVSSNLSLHKDHCYTKHSSAHQIPKINHQTTKAIELVAISKQRLLKQKPVVKPRIRKLQLNAIKKYNVKKKRVSKRETDVESDDSLDSFSLAAANNIDLIDEDLNSHASFSELPEEKYFCNICNFKTNETNDFFQHRNSHFSQVQCPICQLVIYGKMALRNHLNGKHDSIAKYDKDNNLVIISKIDKKVLTVKEAIYRPPSDFVAIEYHCQVCGFFSTDYAVYWEHVQKDHIKPCKCKICGTAFNNELIVVEHMKKCTVNEDHRNQMLKSCPVGSEKSTTYSCHFCNRDYRNKKGYILHLRLHNVNRYFCVFCKIGFRTKPELNPHYKEFHEFGCRKCKIMFSNIKELFRHRFTHEKGVPLICEQCGKSYYSESYFADHMNHHKGIKTHKCKFCPEKFSYYNSLETHRNKFHTDKVQNSYLCNYCGMEFKFNRLLYFHIYHKHENVLKTRQTAFAHRKLKRKSDVENDGRLFTPRAERRVRDPLTGELVSKKTLEKPLIKRIAKCAKKNSECEQCGLKFSYAKHLREHRATHKNWTKYKCSDCNLFFVTDTSLDTHVNMNYCSKFPHENGMLRDLDEEYTPDKDDSELDASDEKSNKHLPEKRLKSNKEDENDEGGTESTLGGVVYHNVNSSSLKRRPFIINCVPKTAAAKPQSSHSEASSSSKNQNVLVCKNSQLSTQKGLARISEDEIVMAVESVVKESGPKISVPENATVVYEIDNSTQVQTGFIILTQDGDNPAMNYYQEFLL